MFFQCAFACLLVSLTGSCRGTTPPNFTRCVGWCSALLHASQLTTRCKRCLLPSVLCTSKAVRRSVKSWDILSLRGWSGPSSWMSEIEEIIFLYHLPCSCCYTRCAGPHWVQQWYHLERQGQAWYIVWSKFTRAGLHVIEVSHCSVSRVASFRDLVVTERPGPVSCR